MHGWIVQVWWHSQSMPERGITVLQMCKRLRAVNKTNLWITVNQQFMDISQFQLSVVNVAFSINTSITSSEAFLVGWRKFSSIISIAFPCKFWIDLINWVKLYCKFLHSNNKYVWTLVVNNTHQIIFPWFKISFWTCHPFGYYLNPTDFMHGWNPKLKNTRISRKIKL